MTEFDQVAVEFFLVFRRYENIVLAFALGGIGLQARRRGVRAWPCIAIAVAGIVATLLLHKLGWLYVGVAIRWLWIGGVFVAVQRFSRGGRRASGTWQCPDCRIFNESTTLKCGCGYRYPDADPFRSNDPTS